MDILCTDQPVTSRLVSLASYAGTWPGTRAAVIIELTASSSPLSAYDITDNLTIKYGRKRHANSVYRALAVLVASNAVSFIASLRKFTVHPQNPASPGWLLCNKCKTSQPVTISSFAAKLDALSFDNKFKPLQFVVEIHGVCPTCIEICCEH